MDMANILSIASQAVLKPEVLWEKEAKEPIDWRTLLMQKALPVIAGVAIVSGLLLKIFGYHIPMIGVVRPTMSDTLIQMVGTVVIYLISLAVLGWIAAYLAGMLGGQNEMNSAVSMLFWVSIPSLLGQVLGTLPLVGWIFSMGLGIYSLVLLYRAIPIFLHVSVDQRVKHFIFFLIAAFVVSMLLGMTLGRLFAPHHLMEQMRPDVILPPQVQK